jgi:hypothetical protein
MELQKIGHWTAFSTPSRKVAIRILGIETQRDICEFEGTEKELSAGGKGDIGMAKRLSRGHSPTDGLLTDENRNVNRHYF